MQNIYKIREIKGSFLEFWNRGYNIWVIVNYPNLNLGSKDLSWGDMQSCSAVPQCARNRDLPMLCTSPHCAPTSCSANARD